jgi:hypothetical protein
MMDFNFDRRRLVGAVGGVSLAGVAPPAFAARRRPDVAQKTSWSESIMVVYLSDDLKTGISYRICRFPDLDDTWVWCQVIVDGKMYAYTDQYLPCATSKNLPASEVALYDAPGLHARMTRLGTSAELQRMSFSFDGPCHPGTGAQEGAGHVPVSLEGIFYPDRTHGHGQTGRVERTGRVEATLRIGGKTTTIAGVGKQHEQTQTGPRFDKAFTYCNLWNANASFLGLFAADREYGDVQTGGQTRAVEKFFIEKPARNRKFMGVLADGAKVRGSVHTVIDYQIPIYDRIWRGTMVSGEVEGVKMVGTVNDWRGEDQAYPASF